MHDSSGLPDPHRSLSAFGTSALVPLLLIAIIAGSLIGIIGCIVAVVLVVWWTLRKLGTGYRLDAGVLTPCRPSRRSDAQEIDLRRVQRTARQRRSTLLLKMENDVEDGGAESSPVHLDLSLLSMDSAVRLRSVMEAEHAIDCGTWGVTGSERARRDRAQPQA